jgi:hypothetical protein
MSGTFEKVTLEKKEKTIVKDISKRTSKGSPKDRNAGDVTRYHSKSIGSDI